MGTDAAGAGTDLRIQWAQNPGLNKGANLAFKKALSSEGVGKTELRRFGERGRAVHEPLHF